MKADNRMIREKMYLCYKPDKLLKILYMNRCITGPDFKHGRIVPGEYIMYYVTKGCMYLTEEDCLQEQILEPGDVTFLMPGTAYVGCRESECEYYYIHFPIDAFTSFDCSEIAGIQQIILDNRNLSYQCDPFQSELYEKSNVFIPREFSMRKQSEQYHLEKLFREAADFFQQKGEHYKLLASCKVMEALIAVSSSFGDRILSKEELNTSLSKNVEKVQSVIDYIHEHYAEKIIGDSIGQALSMDFDYLNRLFKKQLNVTIFTYLNRVRVNKAKELLLEGHRKAYEIAGEVGYCDEFYFSKMFKKEVGVSPLTWLKNAREQRG